MSYYCMYCIIELFLHELFYNVYVKRSMYALTVY